MRKRVISALLVMVLCLSLGATALAADSPNKDNENETTESQPAESKPEESKPQESQPAESKPEESQPQESQPAESKPEESKPQESQPAESKPQESQPAESQPEEAKPAATQAVDLKNMTDNQQKGWNTYFKAGVKPSAAPQAVETLVKETATGALDNRAIDRVGEVDVLPPADYTGGKVTVTFKADVKADDKLIVLHLKSDGTWEVATNVSAGSGEITATLDGFSPVVYVITKDKAPAASGNQNQSGTQAQTPSSSANNNSAAKSPNTGAGSNTVMVVLFVIALGGAAWFGRKCFGKAR